MGNNEQSVKRLCNVYFSFLGVFPKLRNVVISFVMPVICLSVRPQEATDTKRIFMIFDFSGFFENPSGKSKFH